MDIGSDMGSSLSSVLAYFKDDKPKYAGFMLCGWVRIIFSAKDKISEV